VTIVLATSLAAIALAIWGVQAGKARLAAVQAARNSRGITLQTLIITAVLVLLAVAAGVVIAAITRSSQDDLEDTTADLEGIESQLGVVVNGEVRTDLVCATHQVPTLIDDGQHAGKLDCKPVCWVTYSDAGIYKLALHRFLSFDEKSMMDDDNEPVAQGGMNGVWAGVPIIRPTSEVPLTDEPFTGDPVNRPTEINTRTGRVTINDEADYVTYIESTNDNPLLIRPDDFASGDEGIIYAESQPDGAQEPNGGTVIAYGDSCFTINDACDIPQTRRQVVKERLQARSVQNPSGGPATPSLNLEAIRTLESC